MGLRLGLDRTHRLSTYWLACTTLAVAVLAPVPSAKAQWGDGFDSGPSPYYVPAPRGRAYRNDGYGYAPRSQARRYAPAPAPAQEPPRQFYWPWEDRPQQQEVQPRRDVRPPTRVAPRPRPPGSLQGVPGSTDEAGRSRTAPASPDAGNAKTPVAPKTAPTVHVAVFGDSLASFLSKGIDQEFEANPNVAVIDRSRGDSGLVRKDVVDWAKAAEDYLKGNPNVNYGVFIVGVNDRQAIREGDKSYDPLSDKWREIYGARVDAVVKVFADRKIPLVWVGVPPVRFDNMNRDLAAINDLVRERVQKSGQTFVDIWPAFVDEQNRFTVAGPDVDGQRTALRSLDGIHFTNAGSRKAAHFADIELKRLMGANGVLPVEQPTVATTPEGAPNDGAAGLDDTDAIDRRITAMLPSLPEPPGVPTIPVKPAAGPVVPLSRTDVSPGGTLVTGRSREGDTFGTIERSLGRGVAPPAQPGRADDFKWPPG